MNRKITCTISALLMSVGLAAMAQTTLTVKEQLNVNGNEQAFADGSKTVAYTTANNSIWYLGTYDLDKITSIDVVAGMVSGTINDVVTAPQLKFAYLESNEDLIDNDFLSENSSDIRSAGKLLAQIEAVTEPTADATKGHQYPGAKFTVTAEGVSVDAAAYDGTVTLYADNSKSLQKTSGNIELFVYATAQSRRVTIDQVTVHFAGEVIGEGEQSETLGSVQDTYWRMGNTTSYATAASVEVRSDWTETDGVRTYQNDFIAAYEFTLPKAVLSATVTKATLRLVTERAKGSNNMDIFAYPYEWKESQNYGNQTDNIAAARAVDPIASFTAKAVNTQKCLTDEGYEFTDISVWTNYIDLTDYVKSLSSTQVSLLLASNGSSTQQKKFYTKDATDVQAGTGKVDVSSSDLVPQLTVVYEVAGKEVVYISTEKYRTYSSPEAVAIPDGVTAYTVSSCQPYSSSETTFYTEQSSIYCAQFSPIESGVIPANTGVILYAKVPATYSFAYVQTEESVADNLLVAGDGSVVSSGYTFGVADAIPVFSRIDADTTVPVGEAYLNFTADDVFNIFVIEDENGMPTAVTSLKAEKPVVEGIYNLQGIRLNSIEVPGIYIINGRKVAVTNPLLY